MTLIVILAYNCSHIKHNKSRHRQPKVNGKRPVSTVVAQMDGSNQKTRNDSDESNLSLNRADGSKLPLNAPDNTDHPFICPGCRKDFKLFSGFVLHIENRSCKSSICHEIEDRINTCATQLFDTFTCYGI